MNTSEIQELKMAWLAAKAAGDRQAQLRLLRGHPDEQDALIDFMGATQFTTDEDLALTEVPLALTLRARQSALERVFAVQPAFASFGELRKSRQLSKVDVAKGLRLGVDVWNKFEEGAIELVSLTQQQLTRLAQFFQISGEQFSTLLSTSQPALTMNRRQTSAAARKEQGPRKQSLDEAIDRSTMSQADKDFWLEK